MSNNQRFNIEFTDLSLSLKVGNTNKNIINGISGHFHAGKITAIFGPSGCGKTTLMSILRGKVNNYEGTVKINGTEQSVQDFKKIAGFVPQVNFWREKFI